MRESWDPDIAALQLSHAEKDGLQVYRNYSHAFLQHQVNLFIEEVDSRYYDLVELKKVLRHIADDEIRLVPVIACAFLDSALNDMYKREVAKGIPGGREALFGGHGPLSSLSRRIQIAYCFGWMTADVLTDIDSVRRIRNKISHAWDHNSLNDYYEKPPINIISAVEEILGARESGGAFDGLDNVNALGRFRIRLLWVTGRAYYETLLYPWALKRRLDPAEALYGERHPKLLARVSNLCADQTRMILRGGL